MRAWRIGNRIFTHAIWHDNALEKGIQTLIKEWNVDRSIIDKMLDRGEISNEHGYSDNPRMFITDFGNEIDISSYEPLIPITSATELGAV